MYVNDQIYFPLNGLLILNLSKKAYIFVTISHKSYEINIFGVKIIYFTKVV